MVTQIEKTIKAVMDKMLQKMLRIADLGGNGLISDLLASILTTFPREGEGGACPQTPPRYMCYVHLGHTTFN